MIHHISIAAEDPRRVAQVLAEVMQGKMFPFPPHPASYMVAPFDEHGTIIEVYPMGTELVPGRDAEQVSFVQNTFSPFFTAIHAAISVPTTEEQIKEIGDREGWRVLHCNRDGFFDVIEFWLENRLMIELLPPALAPLYLAFTQSEVIEQIFAAAPVTG